MFGAFLLAFVGLGSMLYNLQAAVSNFEFVLSFGCLVFVVIVPILTMRVIAEERKLKTDQLLYSQMCLRDRPRLCWASPGSLSWTSPPWAWTPSR